MESNSFRIAWAAGLFEGEGSLVLSSSKRHKDYKNVCLTLSSTDEDVIRSFFEVVNCGTVYQIKSRQNRKEVFRWSVSKKEEIIRLILLFSPYLHSRRLAKIVESLPHLRKKGKQILTKTDEDFLLALKTSHKNSSAFPQFNRRHKTND